MTLKIISVLIHCLIFLASSLAYCQDQSSDELLNRAGKLVDAGRYLEAVGIYQQLLEVSTKPEIVAESLRKSADIFGHFLDQPDQALKNYNQLIKKHPDSPLAEMALFNSGMILFEKGNLEEALKKFTLYLEKYPEGVRKDTAIFMQKKSSDTHAPISPTPPLFLKPKSSDLIRVAIATGEEEIKVRGSLVIIDKQKQKELQRKSPGKEFYISSSVKKLLVDGQQGECSTLMIKPLDDSLIQVGGVYYRGVFEIISSSSGMTVINTLTLEEYLYSVVSAEAPQGWPLESLKAQAIAARSFAVYQMEKNRDKNYHILASELSQAYSGFMDENSEARKAVNATRGAILCFKGFPVLAYYHSNSGGHTEKSENVWSVALPYMQPIPDHYSIDMPEYLWEEILTLKEVTDSLQRSGLEVGEVKDVVTGRKSKSGRVTTLNIIHSKGRLEIKSNLFRIMMGSRRVKSTFFAITKRGNSILLKGKGYGHGVGMSQWGACHMARLGFTAEQILQHYYKGVQLERL